MNPVGAGAAKDDTVPLGTTWIVGAAHGIGRAIAERFAQDASGIGLVDRDVSALEEVAQHISTTHPNTRVGFQEADVRDYSALRGGLDALEDRLGLATVLIYVAGIYPTHLVVDMTEDDWDRVMETNVKGAWATSQWLAQRIATLDDRSDRRIVIVSSVAARSARPGGAHYCASKAALEQLTKVLAIELADSRTTVNAVAPGLIEVDTLQDLDNDYLRAVLNTQPIARIGDPGEVARACRFLADPASSYITGAVLDVDGGFMTGKALPVS